MDFQNQNFSTQMPNLGHKALSSQIEECIQNCFHCFRLCSQLIEHCLSKGGNHAHPHHIKIMQDCAKICALTGDLMLRQSDFQSMVSDVCAEVCLACAESCQMVDDQDQMMQVCVDTCRRCADSCEQMGQAQ